MKAANNFPHKLNTWIDEEIEIEKIDFNPDTKSFSKGTHIEKLKVKYLNIPKKKYRCKEGEHVFKPLNKGKYVFGCIKCQYARQVYPGVYKLTPKGHLISIASGKRV